MLLAEHFIRVAWEHPRVLVDLGIITMRDTLISYQATMKISNGYSNPKCMEWTAPLLHRCGFSWIGNKTNEVANVTSAPNRHFVCHFVKCGIGAFVMMVILHYASEN